MNYVCSLFKLTCLLPLSVFFAVVWSYDVWRWFSKLRSAQNKKWAVPGGEWSWIDALAVDFPLLFYFNVIHLAFVLVFHLNAHFSVADDDDVVLLLLFISTVLCSCIVHFLLMRAFIVDSSKELVCIVLAVFAIIFATFYGFLHAPLFAGACVSFVLL